MEERGTPGCCSDSTSKVRSLLCRLYENKVHIYHPVQTHLRSESPKRRERGLSNKSHSQKSHSAQRREGTRCLPTLATSHSTSCTLIPTASVRCNRDPSIKHHRIASCWFFLRFVFFFFFYGRHTRLRAKPTSTPVHESAISATAKSLCPKVVVRSFRWTGVCKMDSDENDFQVCCGLSSKGSVSFIRIVR